MENKQYSIIDTTKNKPVLDTEDGKPVVASNPSEDWINWADAKVYEMNDYKSRGQYILKEEII